MDTLDVLLFIVFLIIAYSIYKAIKKSTDSYMELGEQIRNSLLSINNSIDGLGSTPDLDMEDLNRYSKIPTSIEELNEKKKTIAKLYANYLQQKENLSAADAMLRANFEVDKFGIKEVLDEIRLHWKDALKSEDSEKKLVNSDFFKNEIDKFWTTGWGEKRYINPIELFRPIYAFLKAEEESDKIRNAAIRNGITDDNSKNDYGVILNKREDHSYYSYIKNRAIIHNLHEIGLIKFLNKDSDNLLESPFTFTSLNLDLIKKTINDWSSSHEYKHSISGDDKEFEEWLSEHKESAKFFVKLNKVR